MYRTHSYPHLNSMLKEAVGIDGMVTGSILDQLRVVFPSAIPARLKAQSVAHFAFEPIGNGEASLLTIWPTPSPGTKVANLRYGAGGLVYDIGVSCEILTLPTPSSLLTITAVTPTDSSRHVTPEDFLYTLYRYAPEGLAVRATRLLLEHIRKHGYPEPTYRGYFKVLADNVDEMVSQYQNRTVHLYDQD